MSSVMDPHGPPSRSLFSAFSAAFTVSGLCLSIHISYIIIYNCIEVSSHMLADTERSSIPHHSTYLGTFTAILVDQTSACKAQTVTGGSYFVSSAPSASFASCCQLFKKVQWRQGFLFRHGMTPKPLHAPGRSHPPRQP